MLTLRLLLAVSCIALTSPVFAATADDALYTPTLLRAEASSLDLGVINSGVAPLEFRLTNISTTPVRIVEATPNDDAHAMMLKAIVFPTERIAPGETVAVAARVEATSRECRLFDQRAALTIVCENDQGETEALWLAVRATVVDGFRYAPYKLSFRSDRSETKTIRLASTGKKGVAIQSATFGSFDDLFETSLRDEGRSIDVRFRPERWDGDFQMYELKLIVPAPQRWQWDPTAVPPAADIACSLLVRIEDERDRRFPWADAAARVAVSALAFSGSTPSLDLLETAAAANLRKLHSGEVKLTRDYGDNVRLVSLLRFDGAKVYRDTKFPPSPGVGARRESLTQTPNADLPVFEDAAGGTLLRRIDLKYGDPFPQPSDALAAFDQTPRQPLATFDEMNLRRMLFTPNRRNANVERIDRQGHPAYCVTYETVGNVLVEYIVEPALGCAVTRERSTSSTNAAAVTHEMELFDLTERAGVWFPRRKLIHWHATDGTFVRRFDTQVEVLSLNQGVEPEAFTPSGLGVASGALIEIGAPRDWAVWTGRELVLTASREPGPRENAAPRLVRGKPVRLVLPAGPAKDVSSPLP